MSPAEELRAAAAKLRETAAMATEGPWKASPVWSPRSHCRSAVYSYAHPTGTAESVVVASGLKDRAGGIAEPGNSVWIAFMSPDKAEPLADLLEFLSGSIEYDAEHGRSGTSLERYALAIVRVINGGAS